MDTPADEPRGPRGPRTTPPQGDPLKRASESDQECSPKTTSDEDSEDRELTEDTRPYIEESGPPGAVRDLPR